MICPKCNHEIPEGGAFCPQCGYRMTEEEAREKGPQEKQAREEVLWEEPKKKKKSSKGLLIGVIVGAAAIICALLVVVVLLLNGKKADVAEDSSGGHSAVEKNSKNGKDEKSEPKEDPADAYSAALELLNDGKYAQAEEALRALGDYQDAQDQAAYAAARLLMDQGKYAQAKEAFESISVRDAARMATECQNEMTYQEAVSKRAAGEYEAAAKLFEEISWVRDAEQQAAECRAEGVNNKITDALNRKDWATALELLDGPDGKSYPDYANVRQNCFNRVNYEKAKQAMEEKLYYTAYKLFSEMGNYENAASLAAQCQRPTPETGEMSRNSDYKRQTCRLNLKNQLKGGYNVYVRIYDASGSTFVSSTFIRNGKGTVIYLPEDSYLIKAAYGKGTWYGEKEMFGDDAIYKQLFTTTLTNAGHWGTWYYNFEDELEGTTVKLEDF